MSEEIIGGNVETPNNQTKEEVKPKIESSPPTDFKIAEIWIRSNEIHLDAVEGFWEDKIRSIGILEYCKEIVKTHRFKKPESKIITNSSVKNNVISFVRNGLKRKR